MPRPYRRKAACPSSFSTCRRRRRDGCLEARALAVTGVTGREVFRCLQHPAALWKALDIVEDRHQVDVGEREAIACEMPAPGNGLVKQVDLLLHGGQHAL